MASTAICDSFKVEMLFGAHCFAATQSGVSATGVSSEYTLTAITDTSNLVVGMGVAGTGVATGAVIASVDSSSQVTLSKPHTGAVSSVTFTGDTFKALLIKAAPSHTFDHTQTNVGTPGSGTPSASNVGTDEVTGTGYTSGGVSLGNINPSLPGNPATTATTQFSPNPSWSGATFSTSAFIVYNSSTRLGGVTGRVVGVYDLGGTQTVTSGTLTILMPTNDGSSALIRAA